MNRELEQYIERTVIPRYEGFDRAHGTEHVRTVIARSLALARHYDVSIEMVYAVAAYHDTGLAFGRERHHIDAGRILFEDRELRRWFSEEQLRVMREAVEDHGRIVAEADRGIDPLTILRRTIQYGLAHYPQLDRQGHYDRFAEHLRKKYADGGYLRLWLPESDNAQRLEELRAWIRTPDSLREAFDRIFDEESAG